ncbi:MAG: DUF5666 domain-containing protein, partial [Woeseiaceae bacterium]
MKRQEHEMGTLQRSWILFGLTVAALSGCGIDQGGGPRPEQSVQTASVTYGSIDGFGSVILNGETIPTANALFLINGVPGAEADLRLGQVVRVFSIVTDGVKDGLAVDYQSNVQGPVMAVDAVAGTLTVLGQTVAVAPNAQLNIPGVTTLADLSAGTPVEVSALTQLDNSLFTTYVGAPVNAGELRISTMITAVDLNAMQFTIGGITVDYSQAVMLQLPGGQPAVGQIVSVVGLQLGGGGEIIADQVVAIASEPGLFGSNDTNLATSSSAVAGLNVAEITGFDANFLGFIVMSDNASTLT